MTLAAGAMVGPYRLGRLIGRGGMAVVYEATHESIGRTVALKLVAPDLADPGFVERFRHEGRMQAAMDHPHVVTVYEAGTSEYGPYLAMRLVRGTTLAGLIDDGALDSSRTLDLIQQVAEALDAAHDAGLVHRDVKPRNVLVEDGDHAYLADFGLTRHRDADAATATGQFMATIAYVAPEVVAGEPAGPAADRYALAAVLFECLTGSTVFPRPTAGAVLYAHASEPPPRVSGRREGIPAALDEVLIAGLAKDPSQRPARAVDLVRRARAALSGIELGPPAPRILPHSDDVTTAGQVTRPVGVASTARPRRGRRAVALAAVAGALIGAVAGVLLDADDGDAPARAALPAAPPGTERLGPDLSRAGRTVDCRGGPVRADSPNCTVFQERLPGDVTLVAQRHGVVRRWGVRSASGELALSVLRRDAGGYFQIARSQTAFVNDPAPHFFPTDLEIERGDRLAVVVVAGSGVGVREAEGANTGRWKPALAGLVTPPAKGFDGELLLQADYLPGGEPRAPAQLTGAEAAGAPDGSILARKRVRFTDGTPVEVRAVMVDRRGALDVLWKGQRVARSEIPDLRAPIDADLRLDVYVEPSQPRQVGVLVRFTRFSSQRLIQHYFDVIGRRIRFIN